MLTGRSHQCGIGAKLFGWDSIKPRVDRRSHDDNRKIRARRRPGTAGTARSWDDAIDDGTGRRAERRTPGRDIPIPDVSVDPVLSFGTFLPTVFKRVRSVTDADHTTRCATGRTAIAKALECMDPGPDSTVLIPAYHCMSMVEPLSHVGATARFCAHSRRPVRRSGRYRTQDRRIGV